MRIITETRNYLTNSITPITMNSQLCIEFKEYGSTEITILLFKAILKIETI